MKIITQISLFKEEEFLGDLERLQRVINHVPDRPLITKLWRLRGKGRNDWPVEAMWHAF